MTFLFFIIKNIAAYALIIIASSFIHVAINKRASQVDTTVEWFAIQALILSAFIILQV